MEEDKCRPLVRLNRRKVCALCNSNIVAGIILYEPYGIHFLPQQSVEFDHAKVNVGGVVLIVPPLGLRLLSYMSLILITEYSSQANLY
jgi:hypothetical protein